MFSGKTPSLIVYTAISGETVMKPGPVEISAGQQFKRNPTHGNTQHYLENYASVRHWEIGRAREESALFPRMSSFWVF